MRKKFGKVNKLPEKSWLKRFSRKKRSSMPEKLALPASKLPEKVGSGA
jgi:hypothetical protein